MADETGAEASSASTTTKKSTLGYMLVVRHAFADYGIGDEITDESVIKEIVDGEQAVYVIKRATA